MASIVNAVKNTIAENFGGDASHKLAAKEHQFSLEEVPDMSGKVGFERDLHGVSSTDASRLPSSRVEAKVSATERCTPCWPRT